MTENIAELEAALAEGLADMPAHLIPLRNEYLANKEAADALKERQDAIKAEMAGYMKDNGLQGLIVNGKVHARVSQVTNARVDMKALKDKMPHIAAQFTVVTKSQRVTVN